MTHPVRSLFAFASILSLAACFEPVEPEIEPAELQNGAWQLVFANAEVSGDCVTIAMEDAGSFDAIAFIDSDDDELSIWMEGLFLDGGIEGSSFDASGSVYSDSPDRDHPAPRADGAHSDPAEDCGDVEPAGDDGGAAPPCAEPYEPEPNPAPGVTVEIEGTIAAEDVIHGELIVRMVDGYGSCSFSAEMVGIALDSRGGEPEPAEVETGLVEDDGDDTGNIE